MPVLDHEVHAAVIKTGDARYGCWNRPDKFKRSYWAVDRRFYPDGSFDLVSVRVPYTLSHECRYDGKGGLSGDDPSCEGCRHYKASDYVKHIMEQGK